MFVKVGTVVGVSSGLILLASPCGKGPKSPSFALSISLDLNTSFADCWLDMWRNLVATWVSGAFPLSRGDKL